MKPPKCPKCKDDLILCTHGAWNCPNCLEPTRKATKEELKKYTERRDKLLKILNK